MADAVERTIRRDMIQFSGPETLTQMQYVARVHAEDSVGTIDSYWGLTSDRST